MAVANLDVEGAAANHALRLITHFLADGRTLFLKHIVSKQTEPLPRAACDATLLPGLLTRACAMSALADLFETLSQCSQSDSDGEHDFYGIYETTEQQNFQSPPISARLPARMSRSPLFLDHAAPAHTASPATPQGPTPSVRQESSDSDWRPADTVFAGRRASESPTVVSGGCAQWSPARTAQSSHASTPGSGPSAGSNAQPRARSRLQLLSRSHSQYTPTRPGNM